MLYQEISVGLGHFDVDTHLVNPADGYLEIQETQRTSMGETILLPTTKKIRLTESTLFYLLPTLPGHAYKIVENVRGGTVRYVTVPSAGGPLNYKDLVEVDPKTLAPTAESLPAWEAAVDAVRGYAQEVASVTPRLEEVQDALPALQAAASLAQTLLESVELNTQIASQQRSRVEELHDLIASMLTIEVVDPDTQDTYFISPPESLQYLVSHLTPQEGS